LPVEGKQHAFRNQTRGDRETWQKKKTTHFHLVGSFAALQTATLVLRLGAASEMFKETGCISAADQGGLRGLNRKQGRQQFHVWLFSSVIHVRRCFFPVCAASLDFPAKDSWKSAAA
jgi:hypothetical protein